MELQHKGTSREAPRASAIIGVATRVTDLVSERALWAQVQRGAVPEAEWRAALRTICEDAHADEVPPEQLLVELKQAVGILCDGCAVPHGPTRAEFTNRVVTLCIEEYYAGRAEPGTAVRRRYTANDDEAP
jgi:hypothetical protein